MALATKCPHCKTTFRVASDQLKLRGGIVRCGTCTQVFDGNASLVDLEALAPKPPPVPTLPRAPIPNPVNFVLPPDPQPSAEIVLEPEIAFDAMLPPVTLFE